MYLLTVKCFDSSQPAHLLSVVSNFAHMCLVGCTSDSDEESFVKIYHEIFSTVILSLPLIQEMQLPVSGERMCTNTG